MVVFEPRRMTLTELWPALVLSEFLRPGQSGVTWLDPSTWFMTVGER